MSKNIFISDIHLSEERAKVLHTFMRFIRRRAKPGDSLYILGDLFDVWVGDDDNAPLAISVKGVLHDMVEYGVHLFIQRGNRDFMLGRQFMQETGATLLKDKHRMLVAGQPTLLLHGDVLCTDDIAYQKARRKLRNPLFRWLISLRSLDYRRSLAAKYRERSKATTANTRANIMDVNQEAVEKHFTRYKVHQIIHGHTHRPGNHQHKIGDDYYPMRYVLGEWHGNKADALIDNGKTVMREVIDPRDITDL
jgi:UDP-2,3-diacylglucosamine hydrolase